MDNRLNEPVITCGQQQLDPVPLHQLAWLFSTQLELPLHCPGQDGQFEATGLQPAEKGNNGADSPAEADAAHEEEEDEEMVELAAGAEPRSLPKRSATSAKPQLQRLFMQFAHSDSHFRRHPTAA